jgi:hypothetical protein
VLITLGLLLPRSVSMSASALLILIVLLMASKRVTWFVTIAAVAMI